MVDKGGGSYCSCCRFPRTFLSNIFQVEDFARPTAQTTAAVTQWLSDNGVESTKLTPAGDWISFTVPVSKANEMLRAEFSVFTHVDSGKQSIRTLEYSLPAGLINHVKLVSPTTS